MKHKEFCLPLLLLAMLSLATVSIGQSAPTCTVNSDTVTPNCSGTGWLGGLSGCVHKTITCSTVNNVVIDSLGITFGYKTPTSTPAGTIVFFSYTGGTTPSDPSSDEQKYALDYYNSGFQVMQTEWDDDWEDTGTSTKNVAYAAARGAAFLNYVQATYYAPIHQAQPTAGMCAQGNSAGGGLIGYFLAWYNGGSVLDHAEFLSSPPLSNIAAGCDEAAGVNAIVTVCDSGQFGCASGTTPWSLTPYYTDALKGVRLWTDDTTLGSAGVCRPNPAQNTSGQAGTEWNAQSIVDGTVGTFSYPQTSMTAWLCSSVASPDGLNDGTMNNSSSQAQLFFQNFTTLSQVKSLLINGIAGCIGPENVSNSPAQIQTIETDMTTKCVSHH